METFCTHQEESPVISVIVPVYNTKKYLRDCLDSIVSQTLKEIEIIVVNDGSTDSSGEICETYAKSDKRIKVIHTENRGLSAARNLALAVSTAKYVMFVDSDDIVSSDFCEKPYKIAEKYDIDIVLFPFYSIIGRKVKKQKIQSAEGIITKRETMNLLEQGASHSIWNKLYKRQLFETISFPEGKVYEDLATVYRLVHVAKRFYCLSDALYYYRKLRTGSITATSKLKELTFKYEFWEKKNKDLKEWGYDYEDNDVWKALTYLILFGRKEDYSADYENTLHCLKGFPTCLSRNQKIMLLIWRLSPPLFDYLCDRMRRRVT